MKVSKPASVILSLASSLLAAGCAADFGSRSYLLGSADGREPVGTVYEREAARVMLLPDCPAVSRGSRAAEEEKPEEAEAAPAFPLVRAAAAPILTNFAVSAIKDYIQQAKDDFTANYAASGAGQLFNAEGTLANGCLIIVRGMFGPLDGGNLPSQIGSLTQDTLKRTGLARYPDFYFASWLTDEKRNGQILIRPQVLHFAKTAAERSDSDTKFIGVLLALSETAPDPQAGKETVAQAASATVPFEFREVAYGMGYRGKPGNGVEEQQHPLYDQRRTLAIIHKDGSKITGNVNLYAFVTETEDPAPFYQLMIDSITAGEEPLKRPSATLFRIWAKSKTVRPQEAKPQA